MTPKNKHEIRGTFLEHPVVELIAELAQIQIDGSLRVTNGTKKCVVYFHEGRIVFAASNARESRLYEILLKQGRLAKQDLADIPNFQNDFELLAWLESRGRLSVNEKSELFEEQIKAIVLEILTWQDGVWTFDPLARANERLHFTLNINQVLLDYARSMNTDYVVGRFRSMEETFEASDADASQVNLTQEESYFLSCARQGPTPLSELLAAAALTQSTILHTIYSLWLGGFLTRSRWQSALTSNFVDTIRTAKLELKREAKIATVAPPPLPEKDKTLPEVTTNNEPESEEAVITLDEYLNRVETATTYYDILGVDPRAEITSIKKAYFSLAKMFHPDKYRAEGGEVFERVQHAFTELTRAHEALKNPEAREVYDYRMRKEIADREKVGAVGEEAAKANSQAEQASLSFERGFQLLINGDEEAALPYLARAVHYDASVARYHAYYGKALAANEKHRHKAEAEIQTAIKLDPDTPSFRIMLAEFFIQYNLLKRAQGELMRLLQKFPDNREAKKLLDRLRTPA